MDFEWIWCTAKNKIWYFFFEKHKIFNLFNFNDFQNSISKPLIKIRHTLVTDNYLAAEEIQHQDWKYFIERVIEVCKSKEIVSSIQPDE